MTRCSILFSLLILNAMTASAADNLKAFPQAEPGMTRFVLNLPQATNENELRIELVIGKMVKTDGVNRYFFGGELETETVKGWGFNYYILRQLGPMAGTLIGVSPESPQVERFITLGGEPKLMRYNSRLPLVIYVADGIEVRYRLWRAEPELKFAKPG